MGRIVFTRAELTASLSELVGHKAGLALNQDQLASHVDEHYQDLILGDVGTVITLRSEEAEEIFSQLLFGVGLTPIRHRVLPGDLVRPRLSSDEHATVLYHRFLEILLAEFKKQQKDATPFDYTPVAEEAVRQLGAEGGQLALQYYESMQLSLLQNPWSRIRRVEWEDVAQLDDLFASESLETNHGSYLDQRFIDYLSANFSAVDAMNWRKFEGLACEYLQREGYHVEISAGRNDGGIDARAWKSDAERSGPPTILVQCKRQKAKIEKVVIKALWADVIDEGAKSGLVVTTSELSPGAAAVVVARSYPIDGAERSKIRSWIEAMRTPHSGVFLGL